jgi:predicted ATPase/transcriptional regulator with XRE-family HTH domain
MSGTTATTSPSFGALLRRYRERASLSQEELSERAGVTSQAISNLERGERRHPYPATIRSLADALELAEEEREALQAAVPRRGQARVPASSGGVPDSSPSLPDRERVVAEPGDLPRPLTSLVGREDDVVRTTQLLQAGARLLTLTGPGGVGKTRLALQIAQEMGPRFADGVAFVSLASLTHPELVLSTLAQALGVRESGGKPLDALLQRAIGERSLLLVLDNCEHVLTGLTEIVTLLGSCGRLVVLATSREPSRLRGEQEYLVEPLALPDFDHAANVEEAARSSAVWLFVERARAARPDFQLTEDNASTVAAICGRLDGLPLALELAASWIKLLSPDALLERLHRALPLLTGGWRDAPARQQTLRSAIAWSYDLLEEEERTLFRRLSVFAGGCTLEAAEAVCASPDGGAGSILEGLAALVDKSLLQTRDAAEAPRFVLLETLREFAQEQLQGSSEDRAVRERHARYFTDLAETELGPRSVTSAGYFRRLEPEQDNLRAAMDWIKAEGQAELGLRLVCAIGEFWRIRGQCSEGQRRAEEMLAIDSVMDSSLRARALSVAGVLAKLRGDLERAIVLQEEALDTARQAHDVRQTARVSRTLALAVGSAGDLTRARALVEESLRVSRELKMTRSVGIATYLLAILAQWRGDLDEAWTLWEESLRVFRELEDTAYIAQIYEALGKLAVRRGEMERGHALLLQGLHLADRIGFTAVRLGFLEAIAVVAVRDGDPESAARFLGTAEVARAEGGEVLEPPEEAKVRETAAEGRALLDSATWDRAWEEGQAMPLEQTLALATTYARKDRTPEEDPPTAAKAGRRRSRTGPPPPSDHDRAGPDVGTGACTERAR